MSAVSKIHLQQSIKANYSAKKRIQAEIKNNLGI